MKIRIKIGNVCGGVALLVLASCADHWDDFTPKHEEEAEGISFTATVSSSRMVQDTRADGSIVNLNEYTLPETKMRDYWRANEEGTVEKTTKEYYVGVFGCYTGQNKWNELVDLSEKASPTDEETATLQDYYSANLLYNQKAKILEPSSRGTNALEYTPLRFWPNNLLENNATTQHEYCTFWAYYPYNETADPGTYGISISEEGLGKGKGMGSVKFTMHPDAAQQSDFMISEIVTDCNRDAYPLVGTDVNTYSPKPVPFIFHHMLAQVRLYAFIRGTDKIVYAVDDAADDKIRRVTAAEAEAKKQIVDAWGVAHDAEEGEPIPDDTEWLTSNEKKGGTVRWARTNYYDVRHEKKRADIAYSMSFNNIKTECTFTPQYVNGKATISYTDAETLGSATVNHFIMNPYWFRFYDKTGDLTPYRERYMLNDKYMFGYFEDSPVYKREDASESDGIDWSDTEWNSYNIETDKDPLHYLSRDELKDELKDPNDETKHYNYFPGNILMVVPQVLKDDDVPHIVITAKDTNGTTARVTINMLNMNLTWESGFIYCYAFIDELMPGDDKVKGPESITVVYDPESWTDQW